METEAIKAWARRWKETGKVLAELRGEEFRRCRRFCGLLIADRCIRSRVDSLSAKTDLRLGRNAENFSETLRKMKPIFLTAQKVQIIFESEGWKFCFIGGVALQRWAIPRLTNDVDLTLLTGFGNEEQFITRILADFEPRIDDAANFALRNRVLLVRDGNVGIDISLGALEFEASAVSRSSMWEPLPDIQLRTCSAEDLVVFKSFADRLQDWADVENILNVEKDLDWKYINEQLEPLVEAKEAPEILTKLQKLQMNAS